MDLSFYDLTKWNPDLLWILGIISVITFFGTLLLLPLVLIKIPSDYFIHSRRERLPHPKLFIRMGRIAVLILKNLLGALLVLMGFVMLFIPGQGVLTLLAGLFLMNFPGKKRLEVSLISRNSIYHAITRIRQKAGREELLRPPSEPPEKKAT